MSEPILLKTKEAIELDILSDLAASRGINDKEIGSDVKQWTSAIAREIFALYYQLLRGARSVYIETAPKSSLVLRGQDYDLDLRPATKSTTTLRFTVSAATTIPVGTIVKAPATTTRDEIQFVTTETGSPPGAGTVDVLAIAAAAGKHASQLSAGAINQMVSTVVNVTAVTNPAVTSPSYDEEDADTFRARLKKHIISMSRGTLDSLVSAALNWTPPQVTLNRILPAGQVYAEVDAIDTTPFSSVGTNKLAIRDSVGGAIVEVISYTGIDTTITPHRFTGVTRGLEGTTDAAHPVGAVLETWVGGDNYSRFPTSASISEVTGSVTVTIDDNTQITGPHEDLRVAIERYLRGDVDNWTRDPGMRAGGINLSVIKRAAVIITYSVNIQVTPGYNSNAIVDEVKSAIERNTNTLPLGHDVFPDQVICWALDVPGCERVTSLTINGTAYDGVSAGSVTITDSQVARSYIASGNITVTA